MPIYMHIYMYVCIYNCLLHKHVYIMCMIDK